MGRPEAAQQPLRLLVTPARPAVRAYLEGFGFEIAEADPDAAVDVAVVDLGAAPAAASERCAEFARTRPELPIAVITCCAAALAPWRLRRLLENGVTGLLDLQTSREETATALHRIALGGSVVSLNLGRDARTLLREALLDRDPGELRLRLLELVANGLPDHEIGRRLYLSRHTVKHHIEALRAAVGARNRIELAAWAGRHGFYEHEADGLRTAGSGP